MPFERIVAGELGGADLALAQITITDERDEELDFSVPYYDDDAGALLGAGEELTDLKTAKEQRWAVQRGTVEADFLARRRAPRRRTDSSSTTRWRASTPSPTARSTPRSIDLSTALVLTHGRDDVTTAAASPPTSEIGAALPRQSPNVEVVDAALRALDGDGTLADLEHECLAPVFEHAARRPCP